MTAEIKEGSGIYFSPGINLDQVNELIRYAREDPQITLYTSDAERFADIDSLYNWMEGEDGKAIYTLSDSGGKLSGIIWFGVKDIPKADFTEDLDTSNLFITFAIRTYSSARGRGLGFNFMRKAINEFQNEFRVSELGLWLEVSLNNAHAVKLYKNYGFRTVTEPDENGKVIMILE